MKSRLLRSRRETRFVTIFFDLEGEWGIPSPYHFDLDKAVNSITDILKEFKIQAVFNTCGKIMEENPDLVQRLYSGGHEIASHGYAHENFLTLSPNELVEVLSRTETLFKDAVGDRIYGIRPPYLLSDVRRDAIRRDATDAVLKQISNRGYKWISFRKIVFAEEWKAFLGSLQTTPQTRGLRRMLLSAKVTFQDNFFRRTPRIWRNMLDIPLASSMDYDILGTPILTQPSSEETIETLYRSLQQQFRRCGAYFNLNFHPQIIGSCNRPQILKRIIGFIDKDSKCEWVSPIDIVGLHPKILLHD